MNKLFLCTILLLFCIFPQTWATKGVDVSAAVSQNTFNCIKSSGVGSFAIVRTYQSTGKVDPNGAQTIKNAHAAGIPNVDAYHFPNVNVNAKTQVADNINHLKSQGAAIGMLWFDIEGTQYWKSDCNFNQNFLQQMIDQAVSMGVKHGIYSSKAQWTPIMCSTTKFASLPIWYAHYDNNPSFSDWVNFGGWTKPAIKQFQGDTTVCGAGVDVNFY